MTAGGGRRVPRRGALAAGVALGVALLGIAVPGTTGAFTAAVVNTDDTAGAASRFPCAASFAATDNRADAYFQYALTDSGATAEDSSTSGNTGIFHPGGAHPTSTPTAATACPDDDGPVYAPDGATDFVVASQQLSASPSQYTLSIWFSTTKAGGYLLGVNSNSACDGGQFDRHVYVDSRGRLEFGVYDGGTRYAATTASYDDGLWHQVVATMSSTDGMSLWVDGQEVATNSGTTGSQDNTGFWCIGYGNLGGWQDSPQNTYFQGGLRFAAAYRSVLSDAEIAAQYANGRPGT